jgi:copper chaperone CopZ
MNPVTLKIEGMHCDGCVSNMQSLLERQAGIKKAAASFKDKQARILYDPSAVTEDQLVNVIEQGGCSVISRIHD